VRHASLLSLARCLSGHGYLPILTLLVNWCWLQVRVVGNPLRRQFAVPTLGPFPILPDEVNEA
jgi:hypothetical protein